MRNRPAFYAASAAKMSPSELADGKQWKVAWSKWWGVLIVGANAGGNFAHLGGSLFGYIYVQYASNKEISFFPNFSSLFRKKEKPLKTVYKKKTRQNSRNASINKDLNQQEIDKILDKISKSGYDTLSKSEKEFLFKQGKK